MPQLIPVVLNDGQTTPAAVTFSPVDITQGVSLLVDDSAATPQGRRQLTLSCLKAGSGAYRASVKITDPILEVVDGKTVVVDNNIVTISYRLSEKSSEADRADLSAFAENISKNALFREMVKKLTNAY